jgi:formate hydrogenlyase transcriptional activator
VAFAVDQTQLSHAATPAERQTARERDRLRLLLQVSNAMAAHLDLRELLKTISACLRRVVPHDFAGITLYDADRQLLRVHALDFEPHPDFMAAGELVSMDTPSGVAFTERRPVLIRRLDLDEFPIDVVRRVAAQGVKSGCCVPLVAHDRALGTLDVASLREDAFSEEDAELLAQLGGQIALAVENALNFEEAIKSQQRFARERERTQLLLDVSNAVVSHLGLKDLLMAVSACLSRFSHHDTASLTLYDEASGQLRVHALDGPPEGVAAIEGTLMPLDGTPPGLAVTTRQTVLREWVDLDEFYSPATRHAYEMGLRSGCSVPLISHDRVLGTINVASLREAAFTRGDAELLEQIANQVALAVENALAYREIETLKNQLAEEKLYLEEEIKTAYSFEEIVGGSAALKRVLRQVETVAPTDSTVLICGETGTGKELIARAIHALSARRERTLVKLNCAAIPTGLLESELFGHEKGAFTGAVAQRVGRFELAHRGTLFLDEVGDIPLELQPKLLRVLQEQEFERLGSGRTQKVDVRLVAATNCDLARMVADRQFRGDLYYRLNVFPVTLPPLRERREDIPLLVRFFAQKFAHRMKKRIERIPTELMTTLVQYHWPGNVRELENVIERAIILSSGPELEVPIAELKPAAKTETSDTLTLEAAEREHILRVLREVNWVVSGPTGAAARLGMNRSTLQSRMRKLGIARPI